MIKVKAMSKLQNDQNGMAAIIITVVLMMVITIITLGFSQVIRREQRNTLDHQLASQAYYAAESGINLAQNKIKSIVAAGASVPTKSNCNESYTGAPSDFSSQFNIASGVDITCLLIQPKVSTLEYQSIDTHAVPMLVKAEAGTINTITISWQASGNSATTGCAASIPAGYSFGPTTGASPNWPCTQPLLRIDLVALPDSGTLTRTNLSAMQYTSFLYPVTGIGSAMTYSPLSLTGVNAVQCNTAVAPPTRPKTCTATINTPVLLGYGKSYALRVMSIYGKADVTVFANGAGTTNLVDQQVLIDSTAKAQDVLRRVQVRTSITGSAPDFGVVAGGDGSGGICKRYALQGGNVITPTGFPACDNL